MSEPVILQPSGSADAPGGVRELMRLALPLIFSSSFLTVQFTIDRIFLSKYSTEAVQAVIPAVMVFWTVFVLLQTTANFATTFVAQYIGAQRPDRVGPVVRQSMLFSVLAGVCFAAGMYSAAGTIAEWMGHEPTVQQMEADFLRCMAFYALPGCMVASVNSFFAGRGLSWTVLKVDAVGAVVTMVLDYLLIFGYAGFPAMGIRGAGIATVLGACVAAAVALVLMFQAANRREFGLLDGPIFDGKLFRRLMRYGLPSGLQWALDGAAFTVFIVMLGWFGSAAFGASSITFTINGMLFIPMLGIGQAVAILVGQRLGADQAELAERTTWTALKLTVAYTVGCAAIYLLFPNQLAELFRSEGDATKFEAAAALVPTLLWFVAFYSLFDAAYVVFSFALRGAGDTKFVSKVSLVTSWPLMVLPTYLAFRNEWNVMWAWAFASFYILFVAMVLMFRFRVGKWKSMRVIEQPALLDDVSQSPASLEPEPATNLAAAAQD
jgi:MATE family multidrug resistance protein